MMYGYYGYGYGGGNTLYTVSIVLILVCVIFTAWAQYSVNSTFKRYSSVHTRRGLTGAQAAQAVLRANGVGNVRIEHVSGSLTDHYDPRGNVIRLSDTVYGSDSVAAVGVAAHEAGHAVQYAKGYALIQLRMKIIPVCNFGSKLAWPILLLGFVLNYGVLLFAGVALYALATVFQLITLPVELDASRRALKALGGGLLGENELPMARKTLTAAAMTYVAALAASLAQLLRLLAMVLGRRSNNDR